uniref:Transposase n=1 Tax=Panagrellus redivivus TaxID=6233 RepID=A0A7E4URF1_PANRE
MTLIHPHTKVITNFWYFIPRQSFYKRHDEFDGSSLATIEAEWRTGKQCPTKLNELCHSKRRIIKVQALTGQPL